MVASCEHLSDDRWSKPLRGTMYLAPTEPGDTATADAVERVAQNNEHAQDGDVAEVEHRRLMSELSLLEGGRYYHHSTLDQVLALIANRRATTREIPYVVGYRQAEISAMNG